MLKAYYTDFKVALMCDLFFFSAFLLGYILSVARLDALSVRIDPILSVILSLYMLWMGLPLIIENFRSLIDLPLPEKDMLKILKVSTEFHGEYSGFGMLYTRSSGKVMIIEMELIFDPEISLEKIKDIEKQMELRIKQDIPDVNFRIIPKLMPKL